MRKIEQLRIRALESCNFRNHKMTRFDRTYRHWWDAKCKVCGMAVRINDDPAPNGIDVGGEAVALHCTD